MLYHDKAAHTDGDTIVFFRRSDVVVAGDIFVTTSYPFIDAPNGGSVFGIIDGLNRILDLTVPKHEQEGGTYVIPGHGHVCDESEVLEYRDMVTIVKERIEDMAKRGMTVEQVKAAKPTLDYDLHYGADTGFLDDRDVHRGGLPRRHQGRGCKAGRPTRSTRREEMRRVATRGRAVAGGRRLDATQPCRATTRGRANAEGRRALRPVRLLGAAHHRRLALPHADAAQGRLRERAAQHRRPSSRRHVGPGEGRCERQSVQGLRCRQHHATAGPAAHHVGQRHHAEDGVRRRTADAGPPLRQGSAARREDVAGIFGRRVGRASRPEAVHAARPRAPARGALKITTTGMREGYLRKNGVPYSENAVVSEYIDRLGPEPDGAVYLLIRTTVDDPKYLTAAVRHEHALQAGGRMAQPSGIPLRARPTRPRSSNRRPQEEPPAQTAPPRRSRC